MTSYIQLINKIDAFCSAHYQVKRFDAEFGEQRPNLATDSEEYPYVFMSPTSGTPNYDLNQITVDITCYDIIQKDRANLNTIVSDCHLILTDLFGYYNQGKDDDIIALSASQTPLNNYDLDYVAGWSMTITFELEGWCTDAIPMSPIPSGGGGSCEVATYTITDDEGTTLYSGTIASGGDLTQAISDATATLKDTSGVTISTTSINAQGSADITAPDSTYSNTDASYTGNVVSGGSLSIPDSDVNVNSVNEGSVVSVKDIDINVVDSSGSVTPDSVTIVGNTVTIDVPDSSPAPVGATLMKTGQTTSYRTGDDGDLESGRATDFFTLANANPFGTTARFTDELGGSTYTNNIVIDWSTYDNIGGTVLGYYRITVNSGLSDTWNNIIDICLALSIGTFTSGWRLCNAYEYMNAMNMGIGNNALSYSPFNNSDGGNYHTSTSRDASFALNRNGMQVYLNNKANSAKGIACRTFTVTGTTLT